MSALMARVMTLTAPLGLPRGWAAAAVAAGLVAGVFYTASPLTVWALAAMGVLVWAATHDLPGEEGRRVRTLLLVAFALRVAAVLALFATSPHDDQAAGVLFGDEAYALGRAWRARALRIGLPLSASDYVVAFDDYGRSSYITLITFLQWLFGPSPYALRLLNADLFFAAAIVLFRQTRRAFGSTAALGGLGVMLFLPTLFVWSISLLKESLYLALTAVVFGAVVESLRAPDWRRRIGWGAAAALTVWALRDLREGAVALAVASVVVGVGLWLATRTMRTAVVAAAIVAVCVTLAFMRDPARIAVLGGLNEAAKAQAGHVYTVGHSYKLLDDHFYRGPTAMGEVSLTPAEASRFVIRAVVSFLVVPLPWGVESRRELVYVPEQLTWYVLLALAIVGLAESFRRDRLTASQLVATAIPIAIAVALTTGNVGTLIRHRTLIVPYVACISAVGASVVARRLMAPGSQAEVR